MSFASILKKIAIPAGAIGSMFIPGVGPAVAGALGKVGTAMGGASGITKTGLGVLGNILNARAYNQPEKWRQGIVEDEINRRNMIQGMAAPTLAGMLGYRNPAVGQDMALKLGARRK